MHYQAFQPHPVLRPHVNGLYYFMGDAGDPGAVHTFRFPSDGGPELILNLGDPFVAGTCESSLKTFSGGSIIGPLSCHLLTRTAGLTAFVAVRFRPGGIAPFFDVSMGDLADESADIDDFWGDFGRQTHDRVQSASTPHMAVSRLQQALCLKKSHRFVPDRRMHRAMDAIIANRGQVPVHRLARAINLSRRQFERRFKRMTGLSPKRLCRIVRFASVFSSMDPSDGREWARIALECGYSDQAHLIRECRFFTGRTPEAYLKHRSPLENAIFSSPSPMSHFFNTDHAAPAMMPA